jgi:hypothetical protein
MNRRKLSKWERVKNVFRPLKLKPYLIDEKYRVIPAFTEAGIDYWCFDNTHEVPTGRMLAALAIYTELEMKCDKKYLDQHVQAMEKLLSDPKKISISHIVQLNLNLKERLNLAPFPDHIYKMASVIFFDKNESLYSYDYEYNEKKISTWKAAGGTLDFFCRTQLAELIPSLKMPGKDLFIYSQVVRMIDKAHHTILRDLLSPKESTDAMNN